MSEINKKSKWALSLFEYIIAIAVVLNTRSVYLHINKNSNNIFTFLVLLLLLIGCAGALACQNKIAINKLSHSLLKLLCLFAYILVYIFIRPQDLLADTFYLLSFCILAFYFFICCDNKFIPTILYKYVNVIYFIAFYTTFMWLICTKFNLISPNNTLYSTWSGDKINNYFWIYFETQNTRNLSLIHI